MSKKNNKPAVEAPVVNKEEATKEPQVINPNDYKGPFVQKNTAGMTIDSKVLYFATMHDRYGKNVPEDLKDSPQIISGMNAIIDAMAVTIAVEEAVNNETIFHGIIQKNEKAYASLQLVAKEYGVELPEMKALPAPTKEQLEAAGMKEANPDDKAVVTIDSSKVSKEAKEKIAKEKKVKESNPAKTPEEVKDEKQLSAALTNIFIKGSAPMSRVKESIDFLKKYMTLQTEDKDEIAKIEAMSDKEILEKVKDIVGDCPYKDSGIAKFLRTCVTKSGTPIEAYCTLLRSAKNRKTDELESTPELIAAAVRTYVIWSCEAVIKGAEKIIASEERQLKKLDPEKKEHKDGIAAINKNIDEKKVDIEYAKEVMNMVVNPGSDILEVLVDAYNDDKHENHVVAVSIFDSILKTMYANEDMTKYEAKCVEHNVVQYAGIIINLFRDPLSQLEGYSEGNMVELVEATATEEPKND